MPPYHSGPPPVRLALVVQNLNYGGMERILHTLASSLAAREFEVHLIATEYLGHFGEGLGPSIALHQLPPPSRHSVIFPRELAAALRAVKPQVVHSHGGIWFQVAFASRLAGVPTTVHTDHGRPSPVPLIDRVLDNLASRWTDVIVAVSEPLAATLRDQVVHEPSRVRVLTNGVDTIGIRPPTDRAALRRELGLPGSDRIIGSVGRLEPVKNFAMAIRAFARLEAHWPDGATSTLVIVGDGSERARLEALATDLGVASRVRFLGWRPDAVRFYGAFDLFTLTSHSEGTSISLLEAMSSGSCPVVTDVGGNAAVLGPELGALLVPDNDDVAMADAWRRHLNDPAGSWLLGQRARSRVEAAFSLERMVETHALLYHELVAPVTHSVAAAGERDQ